MKRQPGTRGEQGVVASSRYLAAAVPAGTTVASRVALPVPTVMIMGTSSSTPLAKTNSPQKAACSTTVGVPLIKPVDDIVRPDGSPHTSPAGPQSPDGRAEYHALTGVPRTVSLIWKE